MSELQEGLISHLIELRGRLMKALGSVLVAFLCLMPWAGRIYDLIAQPMMANLPAGTKMIATGVITPFLVPLKVTLLAAFIIALPIVLYQAWAFVAPGLYAHEKRFVLPVIVATTLLFLLGMAFCYFFVFGTIFKFIAEVAPGSITPAPDIEQYLSFVMTMFLAFGTTFEVPVVVVLLVKFGIVSLEKLRDIRPYAIVGAFIVAAVVTPPDVTSQILLAVPMCLLYELGLLLARFVTVQEKTDQPS
ncbi:twin-arginine translocase subunit TatC [Denitratisoma oestradiolicum]|uniref:Sec-independent protein translocase protein TatC n=1 Tax=Denitratisoma oestradiolicum TaxID=311182 RepID=A0A6S6XXQ5_9PROT|nr:twin-arginine translocase subunit TatC [Denitratisoma oestradiolicum]TWO79999.1 twin-arginine translocase subunit TatC [Denitratisoma oestradiolicum]CAB1369764.1 TatABCE protein translocation system subunit [Denitratisoma oestradiolicum]